MRRQHLAVPDLAGQCAVCDQILPATPADRYEGKARIAVHGHPRPELGMCVGSRMVTHAIGQLPLFGTDEAREARAA